MLFYDVPRVQGVLVISRAFGGASLKLFVSSEPRMVEGLLGRKNDCLALACEGVWDVIEPEEAVALARSSSHLQEAADRLVHEPWPV